MKMERNKIEGARFLITGGAGFIAAHFIASVIESNEVVVLDTFERNSLGVSSSHGHPNVRVIRGDVRDAETLCQAMDGVDYILHMASIAGVQTVVSNPARTLHINLIGTYNLLEAARKNGNVKRVISFSTSEVYGPNVFRADEHGMTTQGSLYQPRWFYAVSKLAGEFLLRANYIEFGLPTISLRPFNIYGPLQMGEGAVRNFVVAALTNQPLVIYGNGDQVRSWCYVTDVVDALNACLSCEDAVGRHFNIGNPRSVTSILGLAQMILRLSCSSSPIAFREINHPDVEVRVPSITEAERVLGYQPKVDIEDGLKRTIEWFRKYLRT